MPDHSRVPPVSVPHFGPTPLHRFESAPNGRQGVYPASGEFTTSAMAEGAIEGATDDYEMTSPFEYKFRYVRFGLQSASPRDVSKLKRVKSRTIGGTNLVRRSDTVVAWSGHTLHTHN